MRRTMTALAVLGLGALGMQCPPQTGGQEQGFAATLNGAQENPDVVTSASGSGAFTLNAAKTALTFDVTASGLSGAPTAAHFHRGAEGVNGNVIFDISDELETSGNQVRYRGTWTFSATPGLNVADFETGLIYVNIHTPDNPNGEIRGQLTPAN